MRNDLDLVNSYLAVIKDVNNNLDTITHSLRDKSTFDQLSDYKLIDSLKHQRKEAVEGLRAVFEKFDLGVWSHSSPDISGPSSKRYIAFLDLLGFSEVILKNNALQADILMESLIGQIQYALTFTPGERSTINRRNGGFEPDMDKVRLNSIVFSDTILIWSHDDSAESFEHIITAVTMLFQSAVERGKWAMRGAVTHGELNFKPYDFAHKTHYLSQSVLYGKAVVYGHELERNQEWIGCVVSDAAMVAYQSGSTHDSEAFIRTQLIRYPVPFKEKSGCGTTIVRKLNYVIRWGWGGHAKKSAESYFTKHAHLDELPKDLNAKYQNTIDFLDFMQMTDN